MILAFVELSFAYNEAVHDRITREALAGVDDTELPPIAADGPARLRALIDAAGRSDPAWVQRYPTPDAFDAWAEKEFLLLSPAAQVWGIDRVDITGGRLSLLSAGSRQPDDDFRNRDRLAYDAERKALVGRDGGQVPADPALLNMGRLGMLSSQAHAHYGLKQIEFSDDPEVLKSDPPRFAVASGYPKGPILTLAAEMTQAHLDLALLAALDDQPALSALHTGQAFHYLEDVCNPEHTVQVGLYDIFVDAFKARMLLSAKTGGGYLGQLRSLASIGIDMISTYHTLSEDLTAKRLAEDAGAAHGALLVAMTAEEPAVVAALSAVGARDEVGIAATRAVIDLGASEGAPMYAATRTVALPRYRQAGNKYDEARDDADQSVQRASAENAADYERFWALQQSSFRRAGTALRTVVARQDALLAEAAASPEAATALRTEVATRLVRRQLPMLEAAEARRADYLADPPVSLSKPERMPGMLAAELAVLLVPVLLVVRRLRR